MENTSQIGACFWIKKRRWLWENAANASAYGWQTKNLHIYREQARQAGMGIDPFIRNLIEGIEPRPRPPETYAALLQELSAIGNNKIKLPTVPMQEKLWQTQKSVRLWNWFGKHGGLWKKLSKKILVI